MKTEITDGRIVQTYAKYGGNVSVFPLLRKYPKLLCKCKANGCDLPLILLSLVNGKEEINLS